MANGRCRMHGGNAKGGVFHPNYKHGLYSKFLPARFGELFKALEGRDLLDLTEDIKLLHTRLLDIAKRLDSGESGAKWQALSAEWTRAQAAKAQGNMGAMAEALNTVGKLITEGAVDFDQWEKIEDLILKKTKVVESQRKRAVEAHEMLAAQDARAMMRAITEGLKRAVEEHVTDPEIKRKVFIAASSEFARLVDPGRAELVSAAVN